MIGYIVEALRPAACHHRSSKNVIALRSAQSPKRLTLPYTMSLLSTFLPTLQLLRDHNRVLEDTLGDELETLPFHSEHYLFRSRTPCHRPLYLPRLILLNAIETVIASTLPFEYHFETNSSYRKSLLSSGI